MGRPSKQRGNCAHLELCQTILKGKVVFAKFNNFPAAALGSVVGCHCSKLTTVVMSSWHAILVVVQCAQMECSPGNLGCLVYVFVTTTSTLFTMIPALFAYDVVCTVSCCHIVMCRVEVWCVSHRLSQDGAM